MSAAVDLASARDFIAAEEAQLAAAVTILPFDVPSTPSDASAFELGWPTPASTRSS